LEVSNLAVAASSSGDGLADQESFPAAPDSFPSPLQYSPRLFEDFEDGEADGFTELSGKWTVIAGEYLQSVESPEGPHRSWVSAGILSEYVVEVDFTPLSGEETKIVYAHADSGEEYRVDFFLDRSRLCIPAWGESWQTRNFEVGGLNLSYNATYRAKIQVTFAGVRVWLDNVLRHEQLWAYDEPLGDGMVGLGTYAGTSQFDNLLVYAGGRSPNYTIEVDFTPLSGDETKVIYAHADTGENYRVDFWLDRSRLCIPAWGENWDTRTFIVTGLKLSYRQTYHVTIGVTLFGVQVWLDDVLLHNQAWESQQPLGDANVGVGTYSAASAFDNLAVHSLGGALTFFFEDFDDGVADGFTEVGGKWSVSNGAYVQSDEGTLTPYRSWVDGAFRSHVTVRVEPHEILVGQAVRIYGTVRDPRGQPLPWYPVEVAISPGGQDEPLLTWTDGLGNYSCLYYPPFSGSSWQAVALATGDSTYDVTTASPPAVFDVEAVDTRLTIMPSAFAIHRTKTLDIFGQLKPTSRVYNLVLEGEVVSIYFQDAETGEKLPPGSAAVDAGGYYAFRDVELPTPGLWKVWVEFLGSPALNPSSSKDIYVQVKDAAGYAIIVAGKGEDDTGLDSFNRTTDTIYHKFRARGFAVEDIFYLRYGVPQDNGIFFEGPPSEEAIAYAITTWAKEKMLKAPGPLFIVFVGPGKRWQFFVNGAGEVVTPWEMDAWITRLEGSLAGSPAEGQPISFIYGAPYSGSFIPTLSSNKPTRIVVTSSDSRELPVTGPLENGTNRQGEFFVLELFENLARGRDLMHSFTDAAGATLLYTANKDGNGLTGGLEYPDLAAHHPLLDDNGDKIGSFGFLSPKPGNDGFISSHIILGYGEAVQEAQIVEIAPKQVISPGEFPDLWARVNNLTIVQNAWIVVKPPWFALGPAGVDSTVHRDVEGLRVPLYDFDLDGAYTTTSYPDFKVMGTYEILYFVKDRSTGQLGQIWRSKVVVADPSALEPGEFSLTSPENDATVGNQVLLEWSASQKGSPDDAITYVVQVATDPLFTDVVFEKSDIEGTSLLIGEEEGLFDNMRYYWRVRAESFFGKVRLAQSFAMTSTDIGQPLEGSTLYDPRADSYTIKGGGSFDLFGRQDDFRFVHTFAKGDFEVVAKVDYLEPKSSPSFAGIMIRGSLDPGSPYALAAASTHYLLFSASRLMPDSPAEEHDYTDFSLPCYLKLVCFRSEAGGYAEITPSFSSDGVKWTPGQPYVLYLPEHVLVGICVNSADSTVLFEAVVRDFQVSPVSPGILGGSASKESALSPPPAGPLSSDYGTFNTTFGGGLPNYNVLTVLVYNQNDPSLSPPGTTITITPIVGTINNWMYTGYLPIGTYDIDVTAPNFSPKSRTTEVETGSPTTEVFTLAPYPGSVSGKVVKAADSSNLRGAAVELEITSGIYLGTTYDTVTGTDGRFSLTALPSAIAYKITVTKPYYTTHQDSFSLAAGEAKNLGTISLSFPDADSDGLPDGFEQVIIDFDPGDSINDLWDVVGHDDFDGDGKSNGDELLSCTDPTLNTLYLRIVSIVGNSSDSFTVTWTSVTGMLYKVHYSDNFGEWTLARSGIAASGTGQNSWTDDDTSGTIPAPGDVRLRYYRVEAY
jgi:hypothetical protein